MADILSGGLGFVSASLVALIALGFAAMFVFFSGSALIVLGQFLPFVNHRLALLSGAFAVAVTAVVGWSVLDPALWWVLPFWQAVTTAVLYGFVLLRPLHRLLLRSFGAVLLLCGLTFAVSLALPPLADAGRWALVIAQALLQVVALGSWPLVLGGLIRHRRERPVEWFLALRYLVARRRHTFISIISVICVVGVALGVAVITVVLSVMNGFSLMWEEKVIGAQAHLVVHSHLGEYAAYEEVRERVVEVPGVLGATPFLATDVIVRGDSGRIQPVTLKGIDPGTVDEATQLVASLVQGELADLVTREGAEGDAALPGLIVGAQLADRFFLRVGDPIVLISPLGGAPTPLGPSPRMARFRIAGFFHTSFYQFDDGLVYALMPDVQSFLRLADVASGIEVRTTDPYRSLDIGLQIQNALPDRGLYFTRDWKDYYPAFFQALKTERVMMFVLLTFIMVVAGFIIIATLIMMIMEKSRDIAILKAMGCEDAGVLRVFALGGVVIGIAGLLLGLGTGLVITWNLDHIQSVVERTIGLDLLPASVYQLHGLPYHIVPGQLGVIATIAMVLSIGSTLLPSWQASRLDPAEGLRYE